MTQPQSWAAWGDLIDPNIIHDYVWDGDYEEDE